MKLGVFAMIQQLNAKMLNGSHQHHQRAKKFVLKVKSEDMLVCFYDSNGIIHHEFVTEGQTVTGSFYLSVLERPSLPLRFDESPPF
jgi:hypothetical protein